jgi:hypothetical protein
MPCALRPRKPSLPSGSVAAWEDAWALHPAKHFTQESKTPARGSSGRRMEIARPNSGLHNNLSSKRHGKIAAVRGFKDEVAQLSRALFVSHSVNVCGYLLGPVGVGKAFYGGNIKVVDGAEDFGGEYDISVSKIVSAKVHHLCKPNGQRRTPQLTARQSDAPRVINRKCEQMAIM